MTTEAELEELIRDNEGDDDLVKKLRKMLKETQQDRKSLRDQNADLTTANLIAQANLHNLSGRKLTSLKRELEGESDLTPEKVKEIADELGYVEASSTPPPAENPPANQPNQPSNANGNPNQPPESPPVTQPNQPGPDITPHELIERVRREAAGAADDHDFRTKVKNTKSKEELTALIRKEGAKSGIIHEIDHQ